MYVQRFLLQVSGGLRKVEAPQGGTRWHKAAGDSGKVWCEAKNEDGSRLVSFHTWSRIHVGCFPGTITTVRRTKQDGSLQVGDSSPSKSRES